MKRHQSLVLLSRDHHDGLLLAIRLQQGRKALERLWSHDPLWQAEYITRFYDDHLVAHFEAEELFLFPLAEEHVPDSIPTVTLLKEQHREMRAMVEFFKAPDEKKVESALCNFGKLLEDHIRCEEREFFPLLEEALPEETLIAIGSQIEGHHHKG